MVDNRDKDKAPNIEVYEREIEVINRVNILNQEGYKDEDMYIITADDNDVSILKGLTDIVIKEEEDSVWDRFKSFFRGEDTISDAFKRLGIDEEKRDYYKKEVHQGKYLLFVDKGYGSFETLDEYFQPISEEQRQLKRKSEKIRNEEELPDAIKKDIGLDREIAFGDKDVPREYRDEFDHDLKERM